MMEKRKKMDKKVKKSVGAPIITNSSKRKLQNEASGRPEKKRKYVLVDKDWGHRSSNKGLDCLIRDQCKEPTEGGYKESQDLQDQPSPLQTRAEAAEYRGSNQKNKCRTTPSSIKESEEGKQMDHGSSKNLFNSIDVGHGEVGQDLVPTEASRRPAEMTETKDLVNTNNVGKNKKYKQVKISNFVGKHDVKNQEMYDNGMFGKDNLYDGSMDKYKEYDGMKSTGNLYDTAMNIITLRKAREECRVIRGWCEEHNLKATRTSKTEQVWTRSKKTGLYAWKNRNLSVLKCNDPMGSLLRTMDSIDGTGGTDLPGREKAGLDGHEV